MKKIVVLMLFAILLPASLFSQSIQYEVKIKYNNSSSGITADIKVTVQKGDPELIYNLMTNDPIHGKILMKSEPTKKTSYTFKDVKPGKYFLKIEDIKGNLAGKTVIVNENEN